MPLAKLAIPVWCQTNCYSKMVLITSLIYLLIYVFIGFKCFRRRYGGCSILVCLNLRCCCCWRCCCLPSPAAARASAGGTWWTSSSRTAKAFLNHKHCFFFFKKNVQNAEPILSKKRNWIPERPVGKCWDWSYHRKNVEVYGLWNKYLILIYIWYWYAWWARGEGGEVIPQPTNTSKTKDKLVKEHIMFFFTSVGKCRPNFAIFQLALYIMWKIKQPVHCCGA